MKKLTSGFLVVVASLFSLGAYAQERPLPDFDLLQQQITAQQRLIEDQQVQLNELEQTLATSLEQTDYFVSQESHESAGGNWQDAPAVGYSSGFFLASPDGIKTPDLPFTMRIRSWFQLRHTLLDSDGTNLDQNDIEFERLRLAFNGHVHSPALTYFFQIDGDSEAGEAAEFLDYYITYDLGQDLFCWDAGRFGFRAGKWKLPYNRTRAESGTKLQFTDRAMASSFFDINRSLGIALYGKSNLVGKTLNWETALFNGLKTGGFRPTRTGQLDRNFGVSARMFSDVLGDWGSDGEPDLNWHEAPTIRAGAGFAYTRADVEGGREFGVQRVVDSGATLASVLPARVTAYDVYFAATDANFKYHGVSFHSEYYWRFLANFAGGTVPNLFDHGFLLQAGYFVIPERLELVSRYSRIVGDSGTLGTLDQSADEVAAAAVLYLKGHLLKLTFDVTRLNGAPISDRALNILPGDDGMLYRTQLQFWY